MEWDKSSKDGTRYSGYRRYIPVNTYLYIYTYIYTGTGAGTENLLQSPEMSSDSEAALKPVALFKHTPEHISTEDHMSGSYCFLFGESARLHLVFACEDYLGNSQPVKHVRCSTFHAVVATQSQSQVHIKDLRAALAHYTMCESCLRRVQQDHVHENLSRYTPIKTEAPVQRSTFCHREFPLRDPPSCPGRMRHGVRHGSQHIGQTSEPRSDCPRASHTFASACPVCTATCLHAGGASRSVFADKF